MTQWTQGGTEGMKSCLWETALKEFSLNPHSHLNQVPPEAVGWRKVLSSVVAFRLLGVPPRTSSYFTLRPNWK